MRKSTEEEAQIEGATEGEEEGGERNEGGSRKRGIGEKERETNGKEKKENEKIIEIKLLNVQGIAEEKWVKILEETGDNILMCLTETQKSRWRKNC